jgi:murein DD-endopeptidase MepM/ murein hydrolase activator NlpD
MVRAILVMTAVALFFAVAPRVVHAASADPTPDRSNYQVQRGDTLIAIARRYGVTVPAIARANGFKSAAVRLKVGSHVSIPPGARRDATVVRAAKSKTSPHVKAAVRTRPGAPAPHVRRAALRSTAPMPGAMVLTIPEFSTPPPSFAWPVDGPVSSSFGRRRMGWHRGIDVIAAPGTPIAAAASGLVIASGWEERYGRVVKIAHENGFLTVYAHNTENLVDVGDWVAPGQVIATVGRTGRATSEHVHFEIRHDGHAYNPLYLLPEPPRIVQVQETESLEADEDE